MTLEETLELHHMAEVGYLRQRAEIEKRIRGLAKSLRELKRSAKPAKVVRAPKRKFSAETRRKMAMAQRARWRKAWKAA